MKAYKRGPEPTSHEPVLRLLAQGMTVKEITKQRGCTHQRIYHILNQQLKMSKPSWNDVVKAGES